MGTKVTGAANFPVHPSGSFAAVCVDVIDMGLKNTMYGVKDHLRLVYATDEMIDPGDGQMVNGIVQTTLTKTIGKDSNLRKLLEGWRNKPFTTDELRDGFDVDVLLHVPALLNIMHKNDPKDPTKTYANIVAVGRLPRGMTAPDPATVTYVRVKDRPQDEQDKYFARFKGDLNAATAPSRPGAPVASRGSGKATGPLDDEDDDLPF